MPMTPGMARNGIRSLVRLPPRVNRGGTDDAGAGTMPPVGRPAAR